MTKTDILSYRNLSREDQQSFQQWLRANAAVGCAFTLALVAFAAAGPGTEETTTTPAPHTVSFQELHSLAHLDNLPVDNIHDYALVFAGPEPETASAMVSEGDVTIAKLRLNMRRLSPANAE